MEQKNCQDFSTQKSHEKILFKICLLIRKKNKNCIWTVFCVPRSAHIDSIGLRTDTLLILVDGGSICERRWLPLWGLRAKLKCSIGLILAVNRFLFSTCSTANVTSLRMELETPITPNPFVLFATFLMKICAWSWRTFWPKKLKKFQPTWVFYIISFEFPFL